MLSGCAYDESFDLVGFEGNDSSDIVMVDSGKVASVDEFLFCCVIEVACCVGGFDERL